MRSLVGSLLSNKAPVPYAPRTQRRFQMPSLNRNDQTSQMQTYGSVGTLFAIVDGLALGTSQVDWKLYRKHLDGRRRYAHESMDERQEVTSHLALKVWNKPNPFYTRQLFTQSTQQHVDLTGEGIWVIDRAGTPWPSEMWPVRPDRIEPVPDAEKFISGWIYHSPDGEKIPLNNDEVIQLKMPNPLDPYRGMGPVQSVLIDLDATKQSAEWNRNFFLNSAEPGGIIELEEELDDTEFSKFRERWNEQHRGVSAAHRVAILEKGKWVDRKYTQRDMQFAELRDVSREVIREAFRFPKPMLGTVEDVNRANAEAGEVVFARWSIVPRLERIKQALNEHFLPMFGDTAQGVEFDYCNPVPEDREMEAKELTAKANAAKALADAGWDRAGILKAVGLPEIEENYSMVAPQGGGNNG